MAVRADPSCLPLGSSGGPHTSKTLAEIAEIAEIPPGVHPLDETAKLQTGWSSAESAKG
jgi:hypothetical protein